MTDEKIDEASRVPDEEGKLPLMIEEELSDDDLAQAQRRRNRVSDEDEDTWTNQPAGTEPEPLDEELDEEEEENEPAPTQRKAIETARDVVCEELPERASRAAARLKPFLTGTFVFDFTNSGERFLFDWRGDSPSTKPLSREVAVTWDETQGYIATEKSVNVDTVVSISESHLMAVRSGSLNPQVGMLTEKIRVKGKVGPAVYIFNVVAPRARH
jgi:hypothetical protein